MQHSLPRPAHITLTWVSSNHNIFHISDIYKISLLFSVTQEKANSLSNQNVSYPCKSDNTSNAPLSQAACSSNTSCMFIRSPESCYLISIVYCGLFYFVFFSFLHSCVPYSCTPPPFTLYFKSSIGCRIS